MWKSGTGAADADQADSHTDREYESPFKDEFPRMIMSFFICYVQLRKFNAIQNKGGDDSAGSCNLG